MFKEFGVRLHFTPTVLGGDLINLKVRPEVSALDFTNAVTLDGFRIPALSTRRTETEVELRDGQTFAIAGLMNNNLTSSMGKIPGIGDIPVLGLLFRSRAYQKNQTELVVMITPSIIRKGQPGVSQGLPSLVEPYLGRPSQTYPNPDAYTGSPRYPADRPQPREGNAPAAKSGNDDAPAPAPAPAAMAPVPSRPITQTPGTSQAAQPQSTAKPGATPRVVPQPQPSTAPARPAPGQPPQSQSISKDSAAVKSDARAVERAVEKAREQERKAAEAEARQRSEEDRRAEEDRRQADKLAKERAKREAEIARKKAEEDQKRERALAEAAQRLKQAQSAYQAEMEKTKGGERRQQ
jgi:flagellar biosynthesis GTPase FlhF